MKYLQIHLEDDLHQRLKMKTVGEGSTISAVVRNLIEDYVAGQRLRSGMADKTVFAGRSEGSRDTIDAVGTKEVKSSTAKRPLPDLSKSAQVKGKMGR